MWVCGFECEAVSHTSTLWVSVTLWGEVKNHRHKLYEEKTHVHKCIHSQTWIWSPWPSAFFLTVLLYTDLTVEEMFCLILKCEEICSQSAKSHYSPRCLTELHKANPVRRKKQERDRGRKCSYCQTGEWLRFQTQSLWSKLIGCNWSVKYFLMLWPCRIHCSCTLFNRCAPIMWKKWQLVTTLNCGFYTTSVLCLDFFSCVVKLYTSEMSALKWLQHIFAKFLLLILLCFILIRWSFWYFFPLRIKVRFWLKCCCEKAF